MNERFTQSSLRIWDWTKLITQMNALLALVECRASPITWHTRREDFFTKRFTMPIVPFLQAPSIEFVHLESRQILRVPPQKFSPKQLAPVLPLAFAATVLGEETPLKTVLERIIKKYHF